MAGADVELYFDLGSPYAHLAVARAERAIGRAPVLRPVLLGAIFQARGFGSWSESAQRQGRIAELEARAARYGLPPFVWPEGWPLNGLAAMRACVWAEGQGALEPFAGAAFEHEFGRGEDVSGVPALAAIADEVGLAGSDLEAAVGSEPVKARLRELTEEAWARGVRGIPTVAVGETLIYGDDQLEQVPLIT
jgi:2-hydroxychromene-2-carboxylate isomerase